MLLFALLLTVHAAPVLHAEPHTCALVELVHTNLPAEDASAVVRIYTEEAEVNGTAPEPIARRLMAVRGGFWDVLFLGSAFSYSVTCLMD